MHPFNLPVKKSLFFIALLLFVSTALAQPDPEQLKIQVTRENNASQKIDLLLQLSGTYRLSNPDSCLKYARQSIRLLSGEKDLSRMAKADIYVAFFYYTTGHPDSAITVVEKNIALLNKEPALISQLAQYYSLSGLCFMKMDRKKDALDRFYLALQKAEECNDNMTRLKATVNIGWVMMELNQFESAIGNFHKAIQLVKEKKLPENSFGTIYNNLASSHGSLNQLDSVDKYSQIAIRKAREFGDIVAEANGLFILGTAQEKKGQLQDALQNFLQAQELRRKIGDPFFIVSDLAELSNLYAKLGKTEEGISTGEEALKIAHDNNISAKLPMIYTALAANYEASKDYSKAIATYKKINDLKDSMYADANPKAVAEMQTLYETEKKERKIEQQQNHIDRQNFLLLGIGGLVLLSGLLAYSYYKRYKLRQEAKLTNALMKQQEQATKAVIEAEENERQRIARDLHDGVGQMMSAAKMNLSAFESEIKFENGEQKHSFEKVIRLVDESCREVRVVSHIMMPNALLKNNLAAAIHEFVDKLDKKALEVHVYTEGLDEKIDSNTEIVLYRVLQECVNNVIKHAGATRLDISVVKDKDGVNATIEDNGKGFDVSDKSKFEGIGLKNIITRIQYLKGTVDFDSAPGRGTVIALHVPLH